MVLDPDVVVLELLSSLRWSSSEGKHLLSLSMAMFSTLKSLLSAGGPWTTMRVCCWALEVIRASQVEGSACVRAVVITVESA